jgi:hypothetical protein
MGASPAYDASEVIHHLHANDAVLAVDLPCQSDRLVVGIHTEDELGRPSVRQSATDTEQRAVIREGGPEFADLRFPRAADRCEIALTAPGLVTFVGYEG